MNVLAFAEIIGLGIVVASNPVPVISLLALVVRPEGLRAAAYFAAGWAGAILLSLTILSLGTTALFPSVPALVDDRTTGTVLPLIIGLALAVLGVVLLGRRPPADDAPPSRIAQVFDSLTPTRAVFVGAGLALVKPKTLVALVAASTVIGAEGETFGQTLVLLTVFASVGSATIIIPIVLRAAGGPRVVNGLELAQKQISRYFSRVLGALLLTIGVVVTGWSAAAGLAFVTQIS